MPASPAPNRSRLRRSLFSRGGLIGIALVVFGTWNAMGLHRPPEVRVTTAAVTSGPIVRRLIATGTLQAAASVQVGAQISGTILALYADYNSIVHKGQVLATIDPALLNAARQEAEAEREQAQASLARVEADEQSFEAALEDARTKLERAEQLRVRQLIPQADLDGALAAADEAAAAVRSGESQVTVSRAAVEQAASAVHEAEVNLERAVITSPIDGIVVSRNVDVGQTVAASVQAPVLFTIASDFSHMQIEVDVDEADIGGIHMGEPASFEVEAYPDRFVGTVSAVRLQPIAIAAPSGPGASGATPALSGESAPAAISYATIVDVSNPQEKLRPGMTATVTLSGVRTEHAVRIPNAALSFRPPPGILSALKQIPDEPLSSVSAADPTMRRVWRFDGVQFAPVDVRIGITDGVWTELVGGSIDPGLSLVTSAAFSASR